MRLADFAIFRRVEHREVLAYDLFRQVTLDALGSRVPVADAAVCGEHEDGVVGDALHQQAELLLALLEDFLGHLAVGQVTGDLGEAEQFAGRVHDRIDHHVAPETAAVLANAPAFPLETSFMDGRVQRALGQTVTAIVLGVEARKMLAENLGFLVPLETLGTRVPAGNDAVGVDHVDRVVDHRVDQQPESPVVDGADAALVFAH